MLSMRHPAAAPTQGNTLKEVRCKCCFLATGQPHKKSGLPVCMGISSKQLAQKVHVNTSTLALMALAIYRVKQNFTSPCFFLALDAVVKHAVADSIHFNVPFHLSHLQNQHDFPMESRCWSAVWEDSLSASRSRPLSQVSGEAARWAHSKRCRI